MKKRLLAIASIMGLTAMVSPASVVVEKQINHSPSERSTEKRDVINESVQAPRPVVRQLDYTNGGSNRTNAGRKLNQRQYRKHLRQNPQMRKSKKCRL